MLQDLGSDHLPISLSVPFSPVFRPNERPPSFNFQKARWDGFASYIDSHCPSAEEYLSLSLFSAAAAALRSKRMEDLALNAAKSSIPFGRIKRPPTVWWSAEVEEAVSERRKTFAAAHRSDEDRQAYITASRHASSVIAKAKPEAWQTTCSSLSPRSNPKSVYPLLRSIAGSPSSSSSSSNFPNCFYPRKSASIYVSYLSSHFSVSQPKALRSRARDYLSELRPVTCPEESHSSFCSPFTPAEFHAAASNLSLSTATGTDKVAYPMRKHLLRSGMDFLLHIFNFSWPSHSFPSIWKTSSIIPIHKMGKPLDSPASIRPISLTSCVSKLFERIILSRLLFFLESNSILSPRQAGFRPGRSTLDQILYLSQSISDGFNKPRPRSRTILRTIVYSASSWGPFKKSLSLLCKSFLRPLLTYASPGWFPFLSVTNITKLERLHRASSRAITGCLSSTPISLLLTEASLPPLRVTLTHFTLFSYERALPTSFPISGLARLGVKPRLCRSSWRAFASTHPLMLPSTCSREAFLACPSCPPWNLPSFTVESTLSSPCSRSDPPLTCQGAALAHLDSLLPYNLVLWTDGSVAFAFGKSGSGVLANCSLCGTEATFSFSAGPVCSSLSSEACAILHALCWSRQHQQVCHFSSPPI